MDYSDSVNAISSEWEKLLEDKKFESYIVDALMLTTNDLSRKIVNGKPQKAVQTHALGRSINNNANPDKKGLSYLAMRAIHYWKTKFEREMNNPTEKTEGKYCSKDYFKSLMESEYAEYDKLQKIIDDGNIVSKDDYDSMSLLCNEWRTKYEKLDNDYNKNMEASVNAERKYAQQDVIVLEKKIKFMEEELKKSFANNSAEH